MIGVFVASSCIDTGVLSRVEPLRMGTGGGSMRVPLAGVRLMAWYVFRDEVESKLLGGVGSAYPAPILDPSAVITDDPRVAFCDLTFGGSD